VNTVVLSIDDRQDILLTRGTLLRLAGYEVLSALSGYEGLRLFEGHNVDLVVIDYYMPEMSGELVAAEMKRSKAQVPIIMVSAHLDLPEGALKSVDAFLAKGQGPELLLAQIRELLLPDKSRNRRTAQVGAFSAAAAGQISAS
jgi:DNA-binding response OmpR family regulator